MKYFCIKQQSIYQHFKPHLIKKKQALFRIITFLELFKIKKKHHLTGVR